MSETLRDRPEVPFMPHYPEWDNLVFAAEHASVEAVDSSADQYVELRRTLASLYSLNYLFSHMEEGDEECEPEDLAYDRIPYATEQEAYEVFTEGQADEVRLPLEDFRYVSDQMAQAIHGPREYKCMQYYMLISDPLKNPDFMRRVGMDPSLYDHDVALQRLFTMDEYVEARQRYFPSYDSSDFNDEDRELIRSWASLAAFNVPGWAQSQSSATHLDLFPETLPQKLRKQYVLHGLLDVMGVLGNKSQASALAYDKPTHDMLMTAFDVLTSTAEELGYPEGTELNAVDREGLYIQSRAAYFGVTQDYYDATVRNMLEPPNAELFDPKLLQSIQTYVGVEELRTQIRLANASRYASHEQFAALRQAYGELDYVELSPLTGVFGGRQGAYNLDYWPAFAGRLLRGDHEDLKRGLQTIAHTIRRVAATFGNAYWELAGGSGSSMGTVLDMTVLMREMALEVSSPHFHAEGLTVLVERVGTALVPRWVTPVSRDGSEQETS